MNERVVLMTGCASGIARRTSEDLVARGYRVVLTDVDEAAVRDHAEHLGWTDLDRVQVQRLDVRDAEQWERCVAFTAQHFGRLDVLINVAGVLFPGLAHRGEVAAVERTLDVNVKGVMHGTNVAARHMIRQGSGHVVNVASVAGLGPVPGLAVYCASKHAVRAFSLSVALELREMGIAVTVVCPGLVDTPMLEQQVEVDESPAAFTARPLSVEEVSAALLNVLEERPLECIVTVPFSGQGPASKLVNTFPDLGVYLRPLIYRLGRHNQLRARRRR